MSNTFFSATSIALILPIECEDTQSPYLDSLIAFIRFEGQSLAIAFLAIAQFRLSLALRASGALLL